MVINVTSCKSKMVVMLATSLALGVSAVAACVVPWLYCKPGDTADDDRDATAIGDNTDLQSHSNNEHNCTISTVGLRLNGSHFVQVYINAGPTVNPDVAQLVSKLNETANSTSFNEYLPQNLINGESRLPIRPDDIRDQSRRDVDPCITGVAIFVSPAANTKNSENASEDTEQSRDARSSEAAITDRKISESNAEYPDSTEPSSSNATEDTEESRDTQSLEVVVRDIQIVESRLSNSEPTESSFMLQVEVNGTDTQQTTESSNPTDESGTETTLTVISGASGLDHWESNIQTDEQSAEKTRSSNIAKCVESTSRIARASKAESTEPGLSIPQSLERGSIDRSKEDASTPIQTSDPTDEKGDSATEKTVGTSTSRESERSFSSSKEIAVVESSKISEDLDTISEVSSCSESSKEASPRAASPRAVLQISGKTPDSAQSIPHSHQSSGTKKMSRLVRAASRLSNGFKRFLHGIRLDRTPRSSREELPRELHTESVHSVSAGEKLPAGHSTLILEDQQQLNTIRRKRSMTASSGASGLNHWESNIQTEQQSAEKTRSSNIAKFVALKVESTESESTKLGLLIPKSLERGSLQTSHPSDQKGDSSTEKTVETSTSRESERSFSPAKGIAVVESSKISEDLDTISEVSSRSESSKEASPRTASPRAVLQTSGKTPDSAQSVPHNHQNSDTKKTSRRARVASSLSNGFKRFFHGIRLDRTPRSSREELPRELHIESVHSVSAGEKFPAGHSTVILEDQQLLNSIRRRRSMIS